MQTILLQKAYRLRVLDAEVPAKDINLRINHTLWIEEKNSWPKATSREVHVSISETQVEIEKRHCFWHTHYDVHITILIQGF